MRMKPGDPTHRIRFWPHRDGAEAQEWVVYLDAGADGCGPAYDATEWAERVGTPAWSRTPDGWRHHGRRTPRGELGTIEITPLWNSRRHPSPRRTKTSVANGKKGGRPPVVSVAEAWLALREAGKMRGISRSVAAFLVREHGQRQIVADVARCTTAATHPDVLRAAAHRGAVKP